MGREIRRVPPNWEHPRDNKRRYIPLLEGMFDLKMKKWWDEYETWVTGEHKYREEGDTDADFVEWDGDAPQLSMYLESRFIETPTWYQMYENVSEGTPVTPPFETKEEIVEHLVNFGTFNDSRGWGRKIAEKFVNRGWALSGLINLNTGEIKRPRDGS